MLLLPTGAASAAGASHDDADSGQDAPDAWEDAMDVAPANWTGELGHDGDEHDWYRVVAPDEHGLRLTINRHRGSEAQFIVVAMLTDEGVQLDQKLAYGSIHGLPVFEIAPGQAIRLGLEPAAGSVAAYTVRVSPAGPVELSIQSIEILPHGMRRNPNFQVVQITVANAADAPTLDSLLTLHARQGGAVRQLGTLRLEVPAQGSTVLRFEWDRVGQVGSVQLVADVSTRLEADSPAHHATRATPGMADAPVSVDLLNQEVEAHAGDLLSASLATQYHETPGGSGAMTLEASVAWVETHPSPGFNGVTARVGPLWIPAYPYL